MADPLDNEAAARVEAVFVEHRRFIEVVATRYAPSRDDVPDIVQAVGMQLCRSLNTFRGEAQLTTWLYRVTMNEARNTHRKTFRHGRIMEAFRQQPEQVADPDEDLMRADRMRAVREAVEQLPDGYREAVRDDFFNSGVIRINKRQRWEGRRLLRELLADDPRFTD